MGFTSVRIELENLTKKGVRRDTELLVDTGALYSIVPGSLLRELAIEPTQELEFELADGRLILRGVGEARFFFDSRNAISNVVFGEPGDAAVLGVVTLEQLGLEVDPVHKRVKPARLILYKVV